MREQVGPLAGEVDRVPAAGIDDREAAASLELLKAYRAVIVSRLCGGGLHDLIEVWVCAEQPGGFSFIPAKRDKKRTLLSKVNSAILYQLRTRSYGKHLRPRASMA